MDVDQESSWGGGLKRGQYCPKVTHYSAPKVLNYLKSGKNDIIAGANNFENSWWFSIKMTIFVKIKAFIAQKFIFMHNMKNKVKKFTANRLYFEIYKVTHFQNIPILR